MAVEARRILEATGDIPIRLMGGLAIALLTPDGRLLPRSYQDIDFFAAAGAKSRVVSLFRKLGYAPDEQFNAMRGHRRLIFWDAGNERQVDVFVGQFEMCHSWPLEKRLLMTPGTITPADLLLTKLQIFALNEKDQRDILNLLYEVPVGDADGTGINARYIAGLCANDWGLWRTTTLNLERCRSALDDYELSTDQRDRLTERLDALQHFIDVEPKSTRWKLRARVGDRVKWYQEPEEVH